MGSLSLLEKVDETQLQKDRQRVRAIRIELEGCGVDVTPSSCSIRGILRGARSILRKYKSKGWGILRKYWALNRAVARYTIDSARYCMKRVLRERVGEEEIGEINNYLRDLEELEELKDETRRYQETS